MTIASRSPEREASVPHPDKVLVYHIGSLGDTLMALPALWALRELWPCATLVLATKRTPLKHVVVADAILEGTGLFSQVIAYPGTRYGGGTWSQRLRQAWLLARLRAHRFDTAVYLAPSERAPEQVVRDERFFRLAGIRSLIGFTGFPHPPSRSELPLPTLECEAEALLGRLRRDGLAVPPLASARRDCAVGPAEIETLRSWLDAQSGADRGRPWLALAPGSNMAAKLWPIDRYVQVASALVEEFDLWPVAFGGPEDREAGTILCQRIGRGYVAAGSLPLRVAAAAMKGCVLYLGNDTGTMHLAASEGVPCVVPFSARDFPGKWNPMGPQHAIVRRRPACEGCMLERCVVERMRCLTDIAVAELTTPARAILRQALAEPAHRPRGRAALVS
ncbi:MAG: glycosyltransferase family 9 protein [Caldimonas sp.]